MISRLVVFIITIPYVLFYFWKNNKEMDRRLSEINRAIESYGIYGKYSGGSKQGPGQFKFYVL